MDYQVDQLYYFIIFSYGFGFVDFVNEEDAGRAIDKLNGMQIQNKKIKVNAFY